ncbi:MAG: hypothetical protein Q7T34_02005 [Candidatus Parcubacteria bacterium]|nr:hypothetical protein [Candidatus Parcubacteria bacterium]
MDIFTKIIYFIKKPRIILITGQGYDKSSRVLSFVLGKYYKVGTFKINEPNLKDILKYNIFIFEYSPENKDNFKKWLLISKNPILIATNTGEILSEKGFFQGDQTLSQKIKELADILPLFSHLILNYDDESLRALIPHIKTEFSSFGVAARADFVASDIIANKENETEGVNFKINYNGKVVPVWIKKGEKEDIYASLVGAACGEVLGVNLVEISNVLSESF